ncbi:MAG: pyridoxamine 5'-phosphate oxidase family protein [Myxococcales bacterium]|nr:pyridoxamine 5'-phosphate oxidase family protein [Myxococcales bacterium]
MPEQHRTFFAAQPWLVVGARDAGGQPWASILTGAPGFVSSPAADVLSVAALPAAGDPIDGCLVAGAAIGALGIELATRRRNRVNGIVRERNDAGLVVDVEQSFGNCPKYIQKRELSRSAPNGAAALAAARTSDALDDEMQHILRVTDTFFIASAAPARTHDRGCDVSHRGGRPGFVAATRQAIVWPDFEGNYMFNTIGNLLLDARAGLVVPDFASGDLLHVAGRAEIVWSGPEVDAFEGAERLIRLHVERAVLRPRAMPLTGDLIEPSPALRGTGTW